jgi:glycogen operon protein
MRLAGDLIGDVDDRGEPVVGETLLMLLNAHHEPIPFMLPATKAEHHWETLHDTSQDLGEPIYFEGGESYKVQGRSLAVLRARVRAEPVPAVSTMQAETLRKEVRTPMPPLPALSGTR